MNFLVIGPWFHSQLNRDGYSLGPLRWNGITTAQFRREELKPFFDQYLKNGAPNADTQPVLIYSALFSEFSHQSCRGQQEPAP